MHYCQVDTSFRHLTNRWGLMLGLGLGLGSTTRYYSKSNSYLFWGRTRFFIEDVGGLVEECRKDVEEKM